MNLIEEPRVPVLDFGSLQEDQHFLHNNKLYLRGSITNNYAISIPYGKRVSFNINERIFKVKITEIKYKIM